MTSRRVGLSLSVSPLRFFRNPAGTLLRACSLARAAQIQDRRRRLEHVFGEDDLAPRGFILVGFALAVLQEPFGYAVAGLQRGERAAQIQGRRAG